MSDHARDYSRDALRELAPLYAIGATTADETRAIEAALAGDPALAAEVASFRDTASALGTMDSVIPTAALKDDLLAAARRDKVSAVAAAPARAAARTPRWVTFALAASLLLSVGLAVETRRMNARLEDREATLNTILEAQRGLVVVHLTTDRGAAGPGIQFFWDPAQKRAVAHVFRLAPAGQGRAYQVWMLRDGKPLSIAVFNSDPDGHALVKRFALPEGVSGVSDVLVTEEPAGGSPLPTSTPFIGGKVPAI